MVEYLAARVGFKCVRINNHEHTGKGLIHIIVYREGFLYTNTQRGFNTHTVEGV
jgi:hypothetical protein